MHIAFNLHLPGGLDRDKMIKLCTEQPMFFVTRLDFFRRMNEFNAGIALQIVRAMFGNKFIHLVVQQPAARL